MSQNELLSLLKHDLEALKRSSEIEPIFPIEMTRFEILSFLKRGLPAYEPYITQMPGFLLSKDMREYTRYFDMGEKNYNIFITEDKKVNIWYPDKEWTYIIVDHTINPDLIIHYFYERDYEEARFDGDGGRNGLLFIETFTKNGKKGALIFDLYYDFYHEEQTLKIYTHIFNI